MTLKHRLTAIVTFFLIFPVLLFGVEESGNSSYYIKINDLSFRTGIIAFTEITDKMEASESSNLITENLLVIQVSEALRQKLKTNALIEVIDSIDNCRFMHRDSAKSLSINGVELKHLVRVLRFFKLNYLAKNLMETGGFTIKDMMLADKSGQTIKFVEPQAWKLKKLYPLISYRKMKAWGYSLNSFAQLVHCDEDSWFEFPKLKDIAKGGWTVAEVVGSEAYPLQKIIDVFKSYNRGFLKSDIKLMTSIYEEQDVKKVLGLTDIQFHTLQNLKDDELDSCPSEEIANHEIEDDEESTEHLLSDRPAYARNNKRLAPYQPSSKPCMPCVIL